MGKALPDVCWCTIPVMCSIRPPAALCDELTFWPTDDSARLSQRRRTFVTREAVEASVDVGVRERLPPADVRDSAFVNPSGRSVDSMTLAIRHREDGIAVLDALRERRPPFSPQDVVGEFAASLKAYRITSLVVLRAWHRM